MSEIQNDSVESSLANSASQVQADTVQPAVVPVDAADDGLVGVEDFDLDDIEVIESKVFA
jgi:hypothetical protein